MVGANPDSCGWGREPLFLGRPLGFVDIIAMLRDSDLSVENRHVHNALAWSMLEGWIPTYESVALLIDAVAGTITIAEYKERVVASAAKRSRPSR